MKIAIHQNDKFFKHSTGWDFAWIEFCKAERIDYQVIDAYSIDINRLVNEFDCFLWHFSNYSPEDMFFARTVLNAAQSAGLSVFPDFNTSWHFDNKIAESILLKSVNAPIPEFRIFFNLDDCIQWIEKEAEFPVVAKLKCGSGSNNVMLITDKKQAISYSKNMFQKGLSIRPNFLFKLKTNVQSSKNMATILNRLKRIPDFIETLKKSANFPRESGYVYFQEFIPNDGYDIKIVVIDDKLSYICRGSRKNDFRSSGSGNLFFDRSLVNSGIIQSAFSTSDKLGFQCIGYDFVINKDTNMGKIIEMSYGFSYSALLQSGGFWDRKLKWHDEEMNAPIEVIKKLMKDKAR